MRIIGIGEIFDDGIGPLLVGIELLLQDIGEKEEPQDKKHDEQFDKNDCPKCFSQGHRLESFEVESPYAHYEIVVFQGLVFFHKCIVCR